MDYYEVLGLEQDCSREAIETAYNNLKRTYENNDVPNATFVLKQLEEAYTVLSNDVFRSAYNEKNGYIEVAPEEKKSDFWKLVLVIIFLIVFAGLIFSLGNGNLSGML